VQLEPRWGGICNGVASGVMLAASFELIEEGQKYGEGSAVVLGIVAGGVFIFLSQRFVHDNFGEVSMLDVKGADVPKMILVVSIMTLHSFGEGSGVGVSFAGPKGFSQGLMVTIAIAVHNIPEGLAVSLLLSNQGLSPKSSMLWSIFTSLPQPLVAVPAFVCAEAFHKFLPFCMGFAGGCMIWMVMAEVLPDSFKDADSKEVAAAATFAVTFMVGLSALLDDTEGASGVENVNMLLAYLSFGIGPFVGALIHMLLLSSITLSVATATGMGGGVALVVATWKPLQMLLDGKMNIFQIFLLLCAGAFLHFLLRKYVESKSKTSSKTEIVLPGAAGLLSPMTRRACLASFMIWFYTFAEGLAMGVAATSGYNFYLVFPVALHGLPRGVGVGSIVYGATGSTNGSFLAAALTCLAGPMGAISAVFTGVGPNGLESLLVLACGSLFPILTGVLFRRALKVDPKGTYFGISMGIVLTVMCLATTRLVCLHTPYCGISS
jgi:zinc transporter ZupT